MRCGSSREHAPWALLDFGIKCVIAPSYADIFFNNTFKNGMLPIAIDDEAALEKIAEEAKAGREISVDPTETNYHNGRWQRTRQIRCGGIPETLLSEWAGRHRLDDADGGAS